MDAPLHKAVTDQGERRVSVRAGGDRAESRFQPRQRSALASLLEVRLITGRTHQIRVHAAHIGHPILGDDKYGDQELDKVLRPKRLMLHARHLSFVHPKTEEKMTFEADIPEAFEKVAQQ